MFRHRSRDRGTQRPFVSVRPGPTVLRRTLKQRGLLYDVWTEVWDLETPYPDGDPRREMTIDCAYSKAGAYIGSAEDAQYLCDRKGIAPQLLDRAHSVCSIGYSSRDRKWYGWSHRAIGGYAVGDQSPLGDRVASEEQAKAFAEAFAEEVS